MFNVRKAIQYKTSCRKEWCIGSWNCMSIQHYPTSMQASTRLSLHWRRPTSASHYLLAWIVPKWQGLWFWGRRLLDFLQAQLLVWASCHFLGKAGTERIFSDHEGKWHFHALEKRTARQSNLVFAIRWVTGGTEGSIEENHIVRQLLKQQHSVAAVTHTPSHSLYPTSPPIWKCTWLYSKWRLLFLFSSRREAVIAIVNVCSCEAVSTPTTHLRPPWCARRDPTMKTFSSSCLNIAHT